MTTSIKRYITDQVHDTESVNVINEITQQLQDVILTSYIHLKVSNIVSMNFLLKIVIILGENLL